MHMKKTDDGSASLDQGGAIFLKSPPFINPDTLSPAPSSDRQVSNGLTGFQERVRPVLFPLERLMFGLQASQDRVVFSN